MASSLMQRSVRSSFFFLGFLVAAGGCGSSGGSPGNGQGGSGAGTGRGGSGETGGAPGSGGTGGSGTTGHGGSGAPGGAPGSGGAGEAPGTGGSGGAAAASPFIVVDQFGYLPDGEKVAVIRAPQMGFDAGNAFSPGASYALVNETSGARVLTAAPVAWNAGATDSSSGDRAWWFDFSSVTGPGSYYVLDVDHGVRSYPFTISDQVYRDVLTQAVRMLFYQRAGQNKDAAHAGVGWTDSPSFVGPMQDHQCRLFSDKTNAATERDVWGGWYDAGDLNKYTSWTAGYVETLLRAYAENPAVWTDDTNIPESGNGIPDVLDEAKWGLDYLARLQGTDGSVLSIVGEPSASPPSAATGACLYGPASTSATLATAAAFAKAAAVLRLPNVASLSTAADGYLTRAKNAWAWAVANPAVTFKNNDSASGSSGLGSGQQETDDYGRLVDKLDAAAQLFAASGDAAAQTFFDANYAQLHLIAYSNYVAPWDMQGQDAALDYADAAGATASVASAINAAYRAGAESSGNLGGVLGNKDPYLAYMPTYTWGSNSVKSNVGDMLAAVAVHKLDAAMSADALRAASRFVHYLHGTNPLSIVYLTNMYAHGAENCANEMFHTWFADGSALWDRVGKSTYGPPPGYLTGGPNPSYDWDGCCPAGCGSTANNAICMSESITPPKGQPPQKSYKDFNTGWPLDSWSVTEPDDGYQVAYIRLLSKFVR
ncbi:MAG TPA: glycoside hydrolase family 9 protein [Polyangia bacterium]|nr:glycoside hydrolase family 9 protein [Polyangia bacterium]